MSDIKAEPFSFFSTEGSSNIGSMAPSTQVQDGGWGWAIVAASFMAQFLSYGSSQSVGVLYPEWLQTFKQGKGLTAWVGSVVAGVGLIASKWPHAAIKQ